MPPRPFIAVLLLSLSLLLLLTPQATRAEPLSVRAPEQPQPSRSLTGLFDPDPPGARRRVAFTQADSDCIGDPVTPACAIDTLMACFVRLHEPTCLAAQTLDPNPHFVGEARPFMPKPNSVMIYRFAYVARADRSRRYRPGPHVPPRAVTIGVRGCGCWSSGCETGCGDSARWYYYVLITVVKSGRLWSVVNWGDPRHRPQPVRWSLPRDR